MKPFELFILSIKVVIISEAVHVFLVVHYVFHAVFLPQKDVFLYIEQSEDFDNQVIDYLNFTFILLLH